MSKDVEGTPCSDADFEQYTEGKIIVYVVDPQGSKWIWKAWAEAPLEPQAPPEVKRNSEEVTMKTRGVRYATFGTLSGRTVRTLGMIATGATLLQATGGCSETLSGLIQTLGQDLVDGVGNGISNAVQAAVVGLIL